ncbi:hypothetical protein PR048_005397 [Dryococelus australis]|uniref:Uncharacterized protein n=1 Tax=Dryococelus australis TaxID=614101 RepID=A0ABQ9I879_9NEOP|nr:hypothetical protein PR048_005397 [Dryococelus australis]
MQNFWHTLYGSHQQHCVLQRLILDTHWNKVSLHESNGKPCFPTLCKLEKAMLILPHSNAASISFRQMCSISQVILDHLSQHFLEQEIDGVLNTGLW